ncbi:hypothetical protein SS1G_01944 [Sclerotinia sclerotiorum 1980 UF-70]|uniref:Pro-apoptotic serine protease NMA111 n=1 Tax=Sclerotinia sclerotiorum (strain ATCC 18683 / 1980 / Ss-1) TaxID=665079 RepID=A7E9G4_SCLS1|nr:hypothetical protein SS1G_01944 [Sclerotinia sclerotiorum 1980 UF-70]EDN97016.1 hypothetical protein SS1G_01944 [Sclerotinia sclerotiorum 1980 UF-70]
MVGTNGVATRAKRKSHPTVPERPQKQLRALNGKESTGVNTPELDLISDDDYDLDGPQLVPGLAADTAEWQAAIEQVVRNVVSIRFCQTCSFDTDPALTSEATGFVVDAERGYILTNRHVVGSGPFWGYCVFDNHEEVDAYPVYRDPVHDFGILRFDPKAIKYMPVTALGLRPDLAKVGSEIRVVGNDAGEKLSILSGVISRLDRNAPEYGDGYCDFNTNYIQAAAAASGGSSGSPVVNIDGYAVALQAGGRSDGAATDYFLPLDRPLRALQCIQQGKPITRGTIQCQWLIKPFDECRRLGLTPDWEDVVRTGFPKETGMLVAEIVLPEGPSHKLIEEGDLLLKVNGELLTQFIRLDDILDSSVGQTVSFLIQRGGEDIEVAVDVGDLHSITPDRFVSVAGGSFHDLSYQQARLYGVACKGVFMCEASGSFRFEGTDNGWIIQTIDHKKTPDLESFIEVMKRIPDRERVVVTYKHLRDLHTLNTGILQVDRHWSSKMRLAVRNDISGLWDFTDLADALPPTPPVARSAKFIQLENSQHPAAADIVRSFVRVLCHMPVKLDGYPRNRKWELNILCSFYTNMRLVAAKTTITEITAVAIPAKAASPRYRAINIDAITVDTSLSGQCGSGVLIGEDGIVQALWLTYLGERSQSSSKDVEYYLGLATPTLLPVIKKIQNDEKPKLRMLSVEFNTIQMAQARVMGVSEEWIHKVAEDNLSRHQLFMVRKRTFERNSESGALLEGDIILSLNGKIITRVNELDVMYDHEVLDAVIVRDCKEMSIKLDTVSADDLETDRAISFCGAILHRPHHARIAIIPIQPCTHQLCDTCQWETNTGFRIVLEGDFRIKVVTFDNVPWVITMKKNDHYFPTTEWIKDPTEKSGWKRITYEMGNAVEGEGKEGIRSVIGDDVGDFGDAGGADEPMSFRSLF